jgi:hypothetical protein
MVPFLENQRNQPNVGFKGTSGSRICSIYKFKSRAQINFEMKGIEELVDSLIIVYQAMNS